MPPKHTQRSAPSGKALSRTLLAAVVPILAAAVASGFELRVTPPAEYDRYLAKSNVVLADGARAIDAERGIQVLDKEFRPRAMIRLAGIRSFVAWRNTDLVVFTDTSVHIYDSSGKEKASFLRLKEPYPLLSRGDFVGFAELASFREGTTRVSMLTEQCEVKSEFSVPGRFQMLDSARGLGVAWLALGHVPFAPELVSIWKDGAKVRDLARPGVSQHLAVFPIAEGGPLYLWEFEKGDAPFLSAFDLEGTVLWRRDLSDSRIESPKAVASPAGDCLAIWGYTKGQTCGETGLWLLDRSGAVKARKEYRDINEVSFDATGKHLLVAAAGELHSLSPLDGRAIWRRRYGGNSPIASRPPFAFGGSGRKPYLAFLCVDSPPDAAKGETGTSALEVRELATGRLLGRRNLEGTDSCRIEKLSDERLLLRGDSRSWIAEVAY